MSLRSNFQKSQFPHFKICFRKISNKSQIICFVKGKRKKGQKSTKVVHLLLSFCDYQPIFSSSPDTFYLPCLHSASPTHPLSLSAPVLPSFLSFISLPCISHALPLSLSSSSSSSSSFPGSRVCFLRSHVNLNCD